MVLTIYKQVLPAYGGWKDLAAPPPPPPTIHYVIGLWHVAGAVHVVESVVVKVRY